MQRILAAFFVSILTNAAQAEPPKVDDSRFQFDPKDMVHIKEGINWVDIDGDGLDNFIVKAYRNNSSAHTQTIYTFNRKCNHNNKYDACVRNNYETVGFYHDFNSHIFIENYIASMFIYGYHSDIRLIKPPHGKPFVIIGSAIGGESLADPNFVEFRKYILEVSEKDNMYNVPPGFKEQDGVYLSKGHYTDVGEAFLFELGLPDPEPHLHSYFEPNRKR
jgi:hypothetical protein